jgi:hypothetical protein
MRGDEVSSVLSDAYERRQRGYILWKRDLCGRQALMDCHAMSCMGIAMFKWRSSMG